MTDTRKEYELPDDWNIPENKPPSEHHHSYLVHHLRAALHKQRPVTLLDLLLLNRPKPDIAAFARDYKAAIHFNGQGEDLVVQEDRFGITRRNKRGQIETYLGKLEEARKPEENIYESGSYGIGVVDGRKIAAFISNWGFMGASSGAVYGKKIELLMEQAIKENLPAFLLLASGGQRQQEAAAALIEMDRSAYYTRKFQRSSEMPAVVIAAGNLWGGATASLLRGNIVAGVAGTNMGFAGPDVIERKTGERPPEGVQTVEYHFLTNRTVHVVIKDTAVAEFQKDMVSFAYRGDYRRENSFPRKEARGLNFETRGFYTPLQSAVNRDTGSRAGIPIFDFELAKPDTVYGQHLILRSNPRRPDTEYFLQNSFDGYIPLYSHWTNRRKDGIYQRSPGIIAALAYIDDPRLPRRLWTMVIGNQPNYILRDDGRVMKDPASTTAWDYRYQLDMMEIAANCRIPTIALVDLLGSDPTTKSDAEAQFRGINDCIVAKNEFPGLELGYIIGNGGSGGALATLFRRDKLRMLDDAQLWVAVPDSSAPMIIDKPSREDVAQLAAQMKPDAGSLLQLGIVDDIIETNGGAQNDPFGTALRLREAIITDYLELGKLSPEQLLQRGEERLNQLRPIPIGHLYPHMEKTSLFSRVLKRIGWRY